MNRLLLMILAVTASVALRENRAHAQIDSRVDWYTFGMGLGVSSSPGSSAISIIGQTVAGEARLSNTVVQSGFSGYFGRQSAFTALPDTPLVNSEGSVRITIGAQGVRIFSATLFYRMAGQEQFSPTLIDTATLAADIPASVVTIRGVEYYVELSTDAGLLTYPQQAPTIQPSTMRVKTDSIPYSAAMPPPGPIEPRVYKMISVPLDMAGLSGSAARINGLLSDDYGTYRPNLWRTFRWEVNGNGVVGYNEFQGILANVQPGTAFWLITHGGAGFDTDSALSVSSDADYPIILEPGWNQISNPFAYPVAWDTVYSDAGLPMGLPYFFDGQQMEYQDSVAVLNPWEGYFVFNDDPSNMRTIRIPTVDTTVRPPRKQSISISGYFVNMSARVEGASGADSRNSIGFFEKASNETDLYDVPEPPPPTETLQLSIVDSGVSFMRNYKAANSEGQLWEVEVKSPLPKKGIKVSIATNGQKPKEFELYLLDLDQERALGLTDSTFDLYINGKGDVRHLRVIVGTKEFAEKNSSGIPLVPLEYTLDQNFPNPFNPTTTIRYQLNKTGRTVLEIFNILGQRVRTLVDEDQKTGAYTVIWKGENNAGVQVASGVFLYRIRSGDFTSIKKMILLR